jgi:hypothetical protein
MVRAFSVGTWFPCAETAVILAAAWVLYIGSSTDADKRHAGFVVGAKGERIARALYGVALVVFGIAHFAYAKETASLVPKWLPLHLVLAYATGASFVAAGLAVIAGVGARIAASLSALQMTMFTLLVWVPIIAAG